MNARPDSAVVLLSGGLDSATTLALAVHFGLSCHALSFRYGQTHEIELDRARALAQSLGARSHHILSLDLGSFGGSSLVGDQPSPSAAPSTIPFTYVPARNTIFLSCGMALAETVNAGWLLFGANAIDYSGYPDCRPDYVAAMNRVAALATRQGRESPWSLLIEAPLMYCSKARIVTLAKELGLDASLTTSCYFPDEQGRACGRCASCRIRLAAFAEAGMKDPVPYQTRT